MAPFRGSLLRGQCGSACVSEHQCRCEASRLAAIACFASRLRLSNDTRSEEHTSELQSRSDLVCRLLLEKKKKTMFMTKIIPYILTEHQLRTPDAPLGHRTTATREERAILRLHSVRDQLIFQRTHDTRVT